MRRGFRHIEPVLSPFPVGARLAENRYTGSRGFVTKTTHVIQSMCGIPYIAVFFLDQWDGKSAHFRLGRKLAPRVPKSPDQIHWFRSETELESWPTMIQGGPIRWNAFIGLVFRFGGRSS